MTEQRQSNAKEKLAVLINSYVAANKSEDSLLINYAASNLSSYLEVIEITEQPTQPVDSEAEERLS